MAGPTHAHGTAPSASPDTSPGTTDRDRRRIAVPAFGRTALGWLSLPLGLLLSAGLVWQTSTAAFTAQTENPGNSWSAGSVTLTDDDGGSSAMFTATALKPGDTGERCIRVTYGGTIAAPVKLYVPSVTAGTPDLSPHVRLTIDEGTGGGFASCTGFASTSTLITDVPLSTLSTTRNTYATGVSAWVPNAAGDNRTYRVRYTLDAATPDSAQNGSATATLRWEARTA